MTSVDEGCECAARSWGECACGKYDDGTAALRAEVERLRNYRSLPEGLVWQDYYSPDEVIAIRERADAAEAKVAAVEALAEKWALDSSLTDQTRRSECCADARDDERVDVVLAIRSALKDEAVPW